MTEENEVKDWYNKRHIADGVKAWRPFESYPIFLDYLGAKPGKKTLDVGCGTGHLLKAADQRELETYGVDISEEGVKIAQKVSPNSKIIVGKGEELSFPNDFFDYVTCIGALEHFLDIGKGIQEMKRVAKAKALFCIVVPNSNFLYWKVKEKAGTEQRDISETLLTLEQWRDKFNKEGLEILKTYQDRWFVKEPIRFSSGNILKAIKKIVYKAVWLFLPLNYTYQFIFILKKNENK